jgi:hypothetical protein
MQNYIGKSVIIRGYYCGNWAGTLVSHQPEHKTVILENAYRLWQWEAKDGFCLSAIAKRGVNGGKISCPVEAVLLGDCYEIIAATEEAMEAIKKAARK